MRYHHAIGMRAAWVLLAGLTGLAARAGEITIRPLQPGSYEFVLTNATPLSEQEARARIVQAAASVCQGANAVPGKWRYESKEPAVGSPPLPAGQDAFRFMQEVACVAGPPAPPAERTPALMSEAEGQVVKNEVRQKSEAFFKLVAAGRVDEAQASMAMASMGVNEARWRSDKQAFQSLAGEPVQIAIVKLTVYDNPPSAPAPGLYVAADYSNVYRNVPIHCGYLMWFRPAGGGEFRIIREETGHVTAEQLKSISVMRLPEIKRQLRCVAL